MENAVLFLWESWGVLGRVVALLAIVVLALSLENVAVKLIADIHVWRRRRSGPTVEMLRRKAEDYASILVSFSGPAPLAGAMLARLVRTIEYENYTIFVAVSDADTRTLKAVRRAARGQPLIQVCTLEEHEAASPARRLNALLATARQVEQDRGVDFQTCLLLGPESIPHPLTLKLVNWHNEFASVVQLPVLTASRGNMPGTGGPGLDDFGEHRAREMQLRAGTVRSVPAHDIGVALRRDAVWALRHSGTLFDEGSDSPVHDAVQRLGERGYLATFVWQCDQSRKVIAVEEIAPRSFRAAVRCRMVRLQATALTGWRPLGSAQGSLWTHYFNYRDRRIVVVAAALACAGLTALAAGMLLLAGQFVPGFQTMPPLVEPPWVIALLTAIAALSGAASVDRLWLTWRTRGLAATLKLPVELVVAALVSGLAVLRASSGAKASHKRAGAPIAIPSSGGGLLSGGPAITDVLVQSGAISRDAARLAIRYSRRTGRKLALALQDLRLADGATIARGLGEKLGLEFGHIDGPLDSYSSVFLSRHEAERFTAFAQRAEDGGIDVHIGEDYSMRDWRALRAALRRAGVHRPHFRTAPLSEIAYAIRFAGSAQEMAVEQAIAVSLMDGPIPEGSAQDIRRQLRAPYRRLEDLLVERGLIGPKRLRKVRRRIGADGTTLEDAICGDRRIPPLTLGDTVREFNAWRPAIAPLTASQPMTRQAFDSAVSFAPRLAA